MATIKEIVYDVKNIIRGGMQSDDEIISDRQIEFQINSLRAQFIRQDINKRRSISSNIKQLIHCVDLEVVSADSCGLSSDMHVLRSKVQIPNPVETSHEDLITSIGPTGILSVNFHTIDYNRALWAGTNKYTKRMTFAFLLDNFVYVFGPDSKYLEKIKELEIAANNNYKVLLIEQEDDLGGEILSTRNQDIKIDNLPINEWKNKIVDKLSKNLENLLSQMLDYLIVRIL